MANAKKCDRCDKFYSVNETKLISNRVFGSIAKGCKANISDFKILGRSDEVISYDLCDDCLEKLYRFLNDKGE